MKPVHTPELAADPEPRYVVYASGQSDCDPLPALTYDPLPALVYRDGRVMTEWALSDEEIARLCRGERLRLWVWTFGQPLQPVFLEVTSEDSP